MTIEKEKKMTTETVCEVSPSGYQQFVTKVNTYKHEFALRLYMVIVLAHWGEHLVQAFQIWVLKMPRPESRGILGYWFPWLISSETLHYGYALFMLIGLWLLRSGFKGRSRTWWNISLAIQFWHHIEHLLLQGQALFHHNLFGSPVPTSILQLFYPRVELHLFYNTIVFIPMVIGMYYHLFPTKEELAQHACPCAITLKE
jgi:hypothetical protein